MRKYEQQRETARGLTTELCLLLAIAVVGTIVVSTIAMAGLATVAAYGYVSSTTKIVMPDGYWTGIFYQRLIQCGLFTTLAVAGTAAYKTWQLAYGGGRCVARLLGGTRISDGEEDPARKRLLNVVEELAIAAGMRVPPVFVLKDEAGINAFAAGLSAKDAVIGVTQGALERLKRQELQGIIAHEFSHIQNGDMRLNIQLLGVLTGVQAITLAARFLLRLAMPDWSPLAPRKAELSRSESRHSGDKNGGGTHPLGMILALIFGLALWPIGQIGSLFARLIHLAMNRQREFLADASAVQLTRDPQSLCDALTVLLNDQIGSRIVGQSAGLASYMFFASGSGGWQRLLQSHPPLEERIRRLDPICSRSHYKPC